MDADELAAEIVSSAANSLCLDMRFMTMAVFSLRREVVPGTGLPECDGSIVRFRRDSVISDYREERNMVTRQLAHCVFHCLLGHTDPSAPASRLLAEDMIVEYVLDTMDTPHTSVRGRDDRMYACEKIFKRASAPAPDLVAAAVSDLSEWQAGLYSKLFTVDDDTAHAEADTAGWRDLAQQAMTELEGFIVRTDPSASGVLPILRIRNRRRYDYRSFLRRFVSARPDVRENIDEFDPIYYTYGLRAYGNIPLIDSLESSDRPRVDEFVIAIDTSGSTMRGPVVAFLDEAYAALRQAGLGGRSNLHIIQCDDEVRSDDVVGSEADLRRLMDGFRLIGGGGTDFRPVFEYVDSLVEEGVFGNLRGLMYFTDGKGTFPERRPAYRTAFVFCDDRYRDHEVPPWAMRLVVRSADLSPGEVRRWTYRKRRIASGTPWPRTWTRTPLGTTSSPGRGRGRLWSWGLRDWVRQPSCRRSRRRWASDTWVTPSRTTPASPPSACR